MTITTKSEIKDGSIVIPKGSNGQVRAVQWGDKKEGYVVDFPHSSMVYVAKEDATIITIEKVVEEKTTIKTHSVYEETEKKIKRNKQTRKKEL